MADVTLTCPDCGANLGSHPEEKEAETMSAHAEVCEENDN